MNDFVTWTSLGTYAGAVMMVTIITQFLKQTPPQEHQHPAACLHHLCGHPHRSRSL